MPIYAKTQYPNVMKFVDEINEAVCQVQKDTGVQAVAIAAQIALETGWGSAILIVHDDSGNRIDSKNLFNIKINQAWKGQFGWASVPEFYNGKYVVSKEYFKVYDSYAESIEDYLDLISKNQRYAEAWANRSDASKYIDGLAKGGYATAPDYATQIKSIMSHNIGYREDI